MEVILLLFLGPLGLCILLANAHSNKKKGAQIFNTDYYSAGVFFYILSTLISPGLPAYLIYAWSKSTGSANGLAFLFTLPFSLLFFIIGTICFAKNDKKKIVRKPMDHC